MCGGLARKLLFFTSGVGVAVAADRSQIPSRFLRQPMVSQNTEFAFPSAAKRILFVELLGSLRGLMIALPSIHALARSNPHSQLEVLTTVECAPLLEPDPLVGKVHRISVDSSPVADIQKIQATEIENVLHARSYDLVVSDAPGEDILKIVEASTAGLRAASLWQDPLRGQLVEEQFLQVLVREGLIDPHCVGSVVRITLTAQEEKWARCWRGNNLQERHPTVILNPLAGSTVDFWPIENFIAVGRWLASRHHCNIVILSGDDPGLSSGMGHEMGKTATILAKCGPRALAAIASLCSLVISPDTGPARVAAAAGPRAVILFGPTAPDKYGFRPPHINIRSPRLCQERNSSNYAESGGICSEQCVSQGQNSCLEDIAPEVVLRAAERALHG